MTTTSVFADDQVENAYQAYLKVREDNAQPGDWHSDESRAAAIAFLGAICDCYLNKYDGDFIRIDSTDEWQR